MKAATGTAGAMTVCVWQEIARARHSASTVQLLLHRGEGIVLSAAGAAQLRPSRCRAALAHCRALAAKSSRSRFAQAAQWQTKRDAVRRDMRGVCVKGAGRQAVSASRDGRNHGTAKEETIRQHESRARARSEGVWSRVVREGWIAGFASFLVGRPRGIVTERNGAPPQARMHVRYLVYRSGSVNSHLYRY